LKQVRKKVEHKKMKQSCPRNSPAQKIDEEPKLKA